MISRMGGREGLARLTTTSLPLCCASPPGLDMLSTLPSYPGKFPQATDGLFCPVTYGQVLVSDFLALLLLSKRKVIKFRPAFSHKASSNSGVSAAPRGYAVAHRPRQCPSTRRSQSTRGPTGEGKHSGF